MTQGERRRNAVLEGFRRLSQGGQMTSDRGNHRANGVEACMSRAPALMTAQEVCDRLRISLSTFRHHLGGAVPKSARGGDVRLIKQRRIGGRVLFLEDSVDAFIRGDT